ncbi:hypothetical protein Dimus_011232, partial [Dionaea muscipula]
YLEQNLHFSHPQHNVVVKEIENVNKIKMAIFVNHTINFQDFAEKNKRRSELVLELKKIFEVLDIKYNLLPQEISIRICDSALLLVNDVCCESLDPWVITFRPWLTHPSTVSSPPSAASLIPKAIDSTADPHNENVPVLDLPLLHPPSLDYHTENIAGSPTPADIGVPNLSSISSFAGTVVDPERVAGPAHSGPPEVSPVEHPSTQAPAESSTATNPPIAMEDFSPVSSHPMVTRSKTDVHKPNLKYALVHEYAAIP